MLAVSLLAAPSAIAATSTTPPQPPHDLPPAAAPEEPISTPDKWRSFEEARAVDEQVVRALLPRARPKVPAGFTRRSPETYGTNASLDVVCPIIESEAKRNGLPPAFFARLIWKESRFNPRAVSPKGAQGIAQFMPATAAERGLLDPFDPEEAIPHSALFLRELRDTFGNLGLAAAAYNAGPSRVARWLSGIGNLPSETEDFVYSITGRVAHEWSQNDHEGAELTAQESGAFQAACRRLGTLVAKRPSPARPMVRQPWGVQLAADFSQSKALTIYSRIRARFGSVLPNQEPMIVQTRNLSRGTKPIHSVRIGAPNRPDAQRICDRLRAAGGICVVVKN